MSNAHVSREVDNALSVVKYLLGSTGRNPCRPQRVANLGGHAIALALKYPATGSAGSNAASILAAVLEVIERLVKVDRGIDTGRLGVGKDEAENATHFVGLRG